MVNDGWIDGFAFVEASREREEAPQHLHERHHLYYISLLATGGTVF